VFSLVKRDFLHSQIVTKNPCKSLFKSVIRFRDSFSGKTSGVRSDLNSEFSILAEFFVCKCDASGGNAMPENQAPTIAPAHQRDLNADDLPWLLLWPLKRPIDASNNIVDPNVNRSALRAS
jgi:hypothetical protein